MKPPSTDRSILKALLLLFIGVLLPGCGSGYLKDYPPRTLQEEEITKALTAFETAWNTHNEQTLLALLDHDFILWVWSGGNRRIVFRKGTFGFKLRDIFIRWRYLSLGSPGVSIMENEATASMSLSVDGRSYYSTFRLIRKEGKWLFLEWEF